MRIKKLVYSVSDTLHLPLSKTYRVSAVTIDNSQGEFQSTRRLEMSISQLIKELENPKIWPIFICHISNDSGLGNYSFIDSSGQVAIMEKELRATGRFFLLQFFQDATNHSVNGTGSFEVHPLPSCNSDNSDYTKGYLGYYFHRANQIFRTLTGHHLKDWGISLRRKSDSFIDENGMSLPTYKYRLKGSIFYIQSEES